MAQTDGPNEIKFVRSPYSGGSGDCVEVGLSHDGTTVHVRDSKHPDVTPFAFNLTEWAAFLDGARDGFFDLGRLPR